MLKNLRLLRSNCSVTQKALADAIGVSQQSINKYENHSIEPDIETLIKIADFFGTSVDFLIGNTDIQRKIEKVSEFQLNEDECQLLSKYRRLTTKQKEFVSSLINSYTD